MTDNDKFLQGMQKKWGEDIIFQAEDTPPYDVVSTGSYALDFATAIGGIPRGTLVEIYGRESAGKTSLAYYIIAEEQKHLKDDQGIVFINLEGRFSMEWAQTLGVDSSRLIVASPQDGQDAADILYECVNSGGVSLVVFDSIGAMLGKEEMDGKDRVGGQAKLITGMIKRVIGRAWQQRCTIVFLNQARAKMDSMFNDIESPGGYAVKHGSAIRIKMKRSQGYQGVVAGEKKEIGYRVSAVIQKNKAGGSPRRVAQWDFYTDAVDGHELGIDHTEEIMSLSMKPGIDVISRSGAYYHHPTFPGEKHQIQGREGVIEFLRANENAVRQIRNELMEVARGEREVQSSG
jgi:recombination protein RecA